MAGGASDTHDEDMRADLEAMLKASRDLGPDMDRALVDSYMERQRNAIKQANQRGVTASNRSGAPDQPGAGLPMGQFASILPLALVIGAYIAALVTSEGELWWLIFPLMAFGGGWWGRWGHGWHHEYALERRQARYNYRIERARMRDDYYRRRYGFGYGDDDREPEEPRRAERSGRSGDYL